MPVLMDHKPYGQTGEGTEMEIPAADVGLISGGIRSEEHKKLAQEMRKKCKILISLGSCACFGGVPALANQFSTEELLEKVFRDSVTTEKNGLPNEQIAALTDRVYAVHEVVKVDAVIDAFTKGADGVLICGCHLGDCHYQEGNYKTEKRADAIKLMLADFGIEEERFRLEWVSAAEGPRFGQVVRDFTEQVKKLGVSPYKQ